MSGQPCGCDLEQNWICEQHRMMAFELPPRGTTLQEAAERILATPNDDGFTPIEQSLIDTQRHLEMLSAQIQELAHRVEAQNEREKRIAAILRMFYLSTLSMSSVQPLLTLAEELNQGLKS